MLFFFVGDTDKLASTEIKGSIDTAFDLSSGGSIRVQTLSGLL